MKLIRRLRHPRPDLTRRAVPDRAGYEIIALREHCGHEISASIYFHAGHRVLGAPLTGTPGNIKAELREPLSAEEPVPDERLGQLALDALLGYESTEVPSLADARLTDWTTYRASGARSVRAFESATVRVDIHTERGALRLEARHQVPADSPYFVGALIGVSATYDELGAQLRKLVAGAKALKDAGVV